MKISKCIAATALFGLAIAGQHAMAATPDSEFEFHYQAADMQTANGRQQIEARLSREARSYCRAGDGASMSLRQRRDCEQAVKTAVNTALSIRVPEWQADQRTRQST